MVEEIADEWIVIKDEMTGEGKVALVVVEDLIVMVAARPEVEGEEVMDRSMDEKDLVVAATMNIVDVTISVTVIAAPHGIGTDMMIVETDMMIAGTAGWMIAVKGTMTIVQGAVPAVLPTATAVEVLHPIATEAAAVHLQAVGETVVISEVIAEADVVMITLETVTGT